MKKQFLILAGSALLLASCGNDANKENEQQKQMDSIANANAAMQEQINKAKNDSTINALAKIKADSIEKANADAEKAKSTTHKGGKTKAPAPVPVHTVAPAPTGGRAHSDQNLNDPNKQPQKSGGGRAHSDQNLGK